MATLKDVAKLACVDVSTVSRALNNTSYVHPETKERIYAAAKKLGYTQDQLAKRLGKSRANVANMLRLLSLPDEIKDKVSQGVLSYGQARTLLAAENEEKMIALADKTVKEGLSVRELEKLVSQKEEKKADKKPVEKKKDPFTEDVEDRLRRKFSTRVEIGNKCISIRYTDVEDLNRILEIMGVIED